MNINKIFPLIIIGVALIILIIFLLATGKKGTEKAKKTGEKKGTAQYFLNVSDIKDNILYTLDGYKHIFIELEPICIDLLNTNDMKTFIKNLISEISKLNIEFDIFGISQPFDIETLKEQYEDLILKADNDIRRTLLRNSLNEITKYGESDSIVERKFYLIIRGLTNENELIKQAETLMDCFKNSGMVVYRLKDNEIKRLINLFNNITTYNYDNLENTDATIPIIEQNQKKKLSIDEKIREQEKENKGE